MARLFVRNGVGNCVHICSRCVDVECPMKGCTPLHWAAIRGYVEACTVLVHAGTKQELMVKDNAGFTPAQLASDKGHRHVALFLVRNFVFVLPLFYVHVKRNSK